MRERTESRSGRRNLAPALARVLGIVAALLLIAALVANPWVIGRLLVPDGVVTHRGPIHTLQLLLTGLGAVVALAATRVARRTEPLTAGMLAAGLLVTAGTFALCLGATEVVVRTTLHPLHVLTSNSDAWWEYRWRSEHDRRDSLLTRPKYGHDTFDPDLGWSPRPGFSDTRVTINDEGFRAIRSYAAAPSVGVRRIVVVGDSYTWGENVTNAETYVAQMESLRAGVEAINLGVHGYGTDQQLLRLRRDGFPLAPHVVVLAIFGQNMNRNVLAFRDYAKPRFRLHAGVLTLENVPVPSPATLLARDQDLPWLWTVSLTHRAIVNALARTRLDDVSRSEKWHLTRAILEATWRETEAAGARFLLVYVPWRVQEDPLPLEVPIAAWAATSGVPFLDLREAFLTRPASEWEALYGGHWTPLGHRRAAEAILARLDAPR